MRIEDYALIGNSITAALVAKDGSIDWLCLPGFDSPSCFSALLGTQDHGRWKLSPRTLPGVAEPTVRRRYLPGTLVLETDFTCPSGSVGRVTDLMIPGSSTPLLLRVAQCLRGQIEFETELILRFDYGALVPWVRKQDAGGIVAIGGPDTIRVHTHVPLCGENFRTRGRFALSQGQQQAFVLEWHASHEKPNRLAAKTLGAPDRAIRDATHWWKAWSARSTHEPSWQEPVERSLITLKALIHPETGAIVAAPTTSLPERIGGVRNWDYRLCWLRDSTLTLKALTGAGYFDEARRWRDWLLRAVAGKPEDLSIMYGLRGERRLTESTLPWLPGYENSAPVRIGNDAYRQLQLDVYGQVMDSFFDSGCLEPSEADLRDWRVRRKLVEYLETIWKLPDNGIWEVRGKPRPFTHSKVMAWVAFDRAIRAAEAHGHPAPIERWKTMRQTVHEEVCREGYNSERQAFTQYFGSSELDAATLMIPLVGFLPATDPRMRSTIAAIREDLSEEGFVLRYRTENERARHVDGLPSHEGVFLACSFWLADNLSLLGEHAQARELYERLLATRNDVGLMSEEYDPVSKRQLGNFPQAFSHVALINSALRLGLAERPTETSDTAA